MNILSTWFQLEAIGPNTISGHYDYGLVFLSYIVAVLASFMTLDLVGRLRTEKNRRSKVYWLICGAFTMGAGIWSMHFIGMLAYIMPTPMDFKISWTVASLFLAMLASGFALYILQKKSLSFLQFFLGGIFIGLGIALMHYTGMEAMRNHMNIHYTPGLFFLSIFIAVAAAESSLWLALKCNQEPLKRQFSLEVISAFIMGVAICGMHYTGMEAAIFTPKLTSKLTVNIETINSTYLALFIAGASILIIGLTLVASNYYKQLIKAIQNEKEFLKAMLDNLEDGIIACDAEGNITVLNHNFQKHVSTLDGKTKHIDDLFNHFNLYSKDNVQISKETSPLKKILNGERIRGLEITLRFINNITRDVVLDGQQIINHEGVKLGAVTVIHDITELKKTEKLKNEFVSIVSHELRTPLTSIRGSLGLLSSGVMGVFSEKAGKFLEIAKNNCERLLFLINDILDMEKIEAGKMNFDLVAIELNHLLNESIEANRMYAEKYEIGIKLIKSKRPIKIIVDPDRLMQVLANLISNACKFSLAGDKVTIEVKEINNKVRVLVSDNGPGIPIEFQSRIFQKFSQADSSDSRGKGGTGLGLNISKTIIEKLGGSIDFYSMPGEGTVFYFELPVEYEKSKYEQDNLNETNSKNNRLLVCEDDIDQSAYLKVQLESMGFLVDISNTVAQARQLLEVSNYSAVLLDLVLPDQDGIAFIRELKASPKTAKLHIIVLSVIAQPSRLLLTDDEGADVDWLDKPVDLNQLISAISKKNNEIVTYELVS